jgi:hypothetical protein
MSELIQVRGEEVSRSVAWLIIPVYEDWTALAVLLQEINEMPSNSWRFNVLVVNDHPLPPPEEWFAEFAEGSLQSIRILSLRRNVGHQRAIALGFCHWLTMGDSGPVVVMDADGEDRPKDILRLLTAAEQNEWRQVIFAARQKRSENMVFRTGYHLYRHLHLWLTGIPVRFGNFSALSSLQIRALVHQSDLWNHYAASVIRSRLPYDSIPTSRGHRLAGKSRMNLAGWVSHGLSALSIYSDIAGTRVLLSSMIGLGFSILLVVASGVYALSTHSAAAYWAVLISLVLTAIFIQAAAATLLFLFMVLGGRTSATFIPIVDGVVLIGDEVVVWDDRQTSELGSGE